MAFYHEIETAELAVTNLQRAYLQRFGWTETCNTPGAYWMWRRDFKKEDARMTRRDKKRKLPSPHKPYGIMCVPIDLAVSMTVRCLDEQKERTEIEG